MLKNLLIALGFITSVGVSNAVVHPFALDELSVREWCLHLTDDSDILPFGVSGTIDNTGLILSFSYYAYNNIVYTNPSTFLSSDFTATGQSTINEDDDFGFLPIFNYVTYSDDLYGTLYVDDDNSYYHSTGFPFYNDSLVNIKNVALYSYYHTTTGVDRIDDIYFNETIFNIWIQCNFTCYVQYTITCFDWDTEKVQSSTRTLSLTGVQTGFNSSSATHNLTCLSMNNMIYDQFNNDLWISEQYRSGYYSGLDLSNIEKFSMSIRIYTDNNQLDYDHGYTDGYNNGQNTGYNQGYTAGFNAGSSSNSRLLNLFSSIADTPVLMIRSMFSFELFGISMYTAVLSLITLLFILFIVKRLL